MTFCEFVKSFRQKKTSKKEVAIKYQIDKTIGTYLAIGKVLHNDFIYRRTLQRNSALSHIKNVKVLLQEYDEWGAELVSEIKV